ncbi:DUF4340 domain-containing protein [Arenimonas sp. MALMAid1274]|uniref:DUF4340 domain-containing protein n=1 Tax=Arenimonas sp. MALMAid1274 TaxID=3411630 RepID=UPI003BA241EC
MRPVRLLALAAAVLALAGAAWWLLDRDGAGQGDGPGLLALGFAARVDTIDRIEVTGAGKAALVTLEKVQGQWRMPDRDQWPGNQREISRALFRLGQARRIEAKTARPSLHVRLGVEDLAAADAKGVGLRLSGGGSEPLALVVGNNHPSLGGSYVRVGDDPQAWLLDQDIAPARNPADWLDRRLIDLPMARVQTVRVTPAQGRSFVLSRRDDDFVLEGLASAALANPDAGNAIAGFTDQLPLDDVARDSGTAPTQTAVFESVDGLAVTVSTWPGEGSQTWARLSVSLDRERASAWFARGAADDTARQEAGDPATRLAALEAQVAAWQASFEGRQFLLPPYKAQALAKSRGDYLAGQP